MYVCKTHHASLIFAADPSVPQAVHRTWSLVVPCPHPTFSWGKDLVTIEHFLAVVLCQRAVSQLIFINPTMTPLWFAMFHWLAQIDTGWVVSVDDIQAATHYYQLVQWSHTEPKSQHYDCNHGNIAIYYQRASTVNMSEAMLDVEMLTRNTQSSLVCRSRPAFLSCRRWKVRGYTGNKVLF